MEKFNEFLMTCHEQHADVIIRMDYSNPSLVVVTDDLNDLFICLKEKAEAERELKNYLEGLDE